MSLKILNPGYQPLGQFDCLDGYMPSIKGGEIATLVGLTISGSTDQAAQDVFDGYADSTTPQRPVATLNILAASRPLMLTDDGITGYGTLLGSVVGSVVGKTVTGGATLGPSSLSGSGKLTLWDKPGLYAVSLDNVDTNLQPTGATPTTGTAVYATLNSGLLTATAGSNPQVGHFIEFVTNGSLVTTPSYLVAALNSPSGNVTSAGPRQFAYMVMYFSPPA